MAIKKLKANKRVTKSNDRILEIKESLKEIMDQIIDLESKKRELLEEYLSLEIAPFKIGEYALVKVPSGKSMKEQKCLLECEGGTLYARPVKLNGKLSSRHFTIIPNGKNKYTDYLKEV